MNRFAGAVYRLLGRHACDVLTTLDVGPALMLHQVSLVDCWIGITRDGDRRVVSLAGRLGAAQVPELLGACLEAGRPLQLDLSDLISVDVAGVEAIMRMRAQGVMLVGVPGYIQMKLGLPIDQRPKAD